MAEMSEIAQKSQHDEEVEIDIKDSISEEDLDSFYNSSKYRNWDNNGRQPLHIASMLGRLDVLVNLLKQGVDIDCTDNDGWTALDHSSNQGKLDVVKYLIDNNATINRQTNDGGTALFWAVLSEHKDVVEYLCSKKADIRIIDSFNKTALDWAGDFNNTEILTILEKYNDQS